MGTAPGMLRVRCHRLSWAGCALQRVDVSQPQPCPGRRGEEPRCRGRWPSPTREPNGGCVVMGTADPTGLLGPRPPGTPAVSCQR